MTCKRLFSCFPASSSSRLTKPSPFLSWSPEQGGKEKHHQKPRLDTKGQCIFVFVCCLPTRKNILQSLQSLTAFLDCLALNSSMPKWSYPSVFHPRPRPTLWRTRWAFDERLKAVGRLWGGMLSQRSGIWLCLNESFPNNTIKYMLW